MVVYFDQVEADLLHYYGCDLPAGLWGDRPLTVRRFSALVRSLPPDSATARAVATDPGLAVSEPPPRRPASDETIRAFGGQVRYVTREG